MNDKDTKDQTEIKDYNTIDDIDDYLRGVVAANASRRLPFLGN